MTNQKDIFSYLVPGKCAHLAGIGGVSMSPLAEVLHGMGLKVQGSDMNDGPSVEHLRSLGIPVAIGHAADNLGECDFVVEYKKPEKEGAMHWIKVAVICLITMVGSGYGIIAYNNDVSTTDIFDRVYELLGASAFEPTNIMEIAYAVGLFVGIVIFYDHFVGQKLSKAPTPLEVEMDKYDKDVSESVIDREGGK